MEFWIGATMFLLGFIVGGLVVVHANDLEDK